MAPDRSAAVSRALVDLRRPVTSAEATRIQWLWAAGKDTMDIASEIGRHECVVVSVLSRTLRRAA